MISSPEPTQTHTEFENAMETTATYARPELLQVAETVARDKGIDRDEVLEAMEQAIQKAGRSKYGQEYDIRAEIDRKSGEIRLLRFREVAEPVENEATQITLAAAQRLNPEAEIGDYITDPLPPIDFGRIAAQTAKQVIVQKVRDAERQRQYLEFKDRVGEIVNGLVKRVEFGNVVVDLGRAEAMLRRDELLPRESFHQGERVRAYIYDVRQEPRGPQIFLSRTHPQFMAKLFAQEVPEIYDGIIEIRAVARDPGSRAKIAVTSRDSGIDPVGACVGMRGSRVQAVVGELQGEKIDIIPWSPDPATFVVNGLAPAEVAKVVMDEEQRRIEVVVPDDQLSLAIGRRGQNVRLASQLTGWDIDILTEAEESERRTEEFRGRSQMFIDALDIDDVIAHLLVTEGFTSLEEVAFVPLKDLAEIEGFDEEIAAELQDRARHALERRDREYEERRRALGVADDLAALDGLTPGMLVALGEKGIKTLDDFAGLAGDELLELLGGSDKAGTKLEPAEADALIMRARAHWFADEGVADEGVADGGFAEQRAAGGRRSGSARAATALSRDRRDPRPFCFAALCGRTRR
jgi:N utilization substance protein A